MISLLPNRAGLQMCADVADITNLNNRGEGSKVK
jgi:hypothetical protein